MNDLSDDHIFYHALAKGTFGDRRTLLKLKRICNTWNQAFAYFIKKGGDAPSPGCAREELARLSIELLMQDDGGYPPILREIPAPPFGIYVRRNTGTPLTGELAAPQERSLAIVGTRRATPGGKHTAYHFAEKLAETGFRIVSGLAFGIDAAAHEGCLDGDGVTTAVLACGLDSIYPETNSRLAERILAHGGALVSEYPPGEPALPRRFLERNRLISGLTQGTLIIEAPDRSGSLATANFALEQNRDLFVIPGDISHPNFKGSHALIRRGAELVTCPEEILEAYGISEATRKEINFARQEHMLTPEEAAIVHVLRESSRPLEVDKIIILAKLEPRIANQTLTFLIMKELVKETDSGYIIG